MIDKFTWVRVQYSAYDIEVVMQPYLRVGRTYKTSDGSTVVLKKYKGHGYYYHHFENESGKACTPESIQVPTKHMADGWNGSGFWDSIPDEVKQKVGKNLPTWGIVKPMKMLTERDMKWIRLKGKIRRAIYRIKKLVGLR